MNLLPIPTESFSSRVGRLLEGSDPPESIISLCSDVRTPLELKLIEKLRTKLQPDICIESKHNQQRLIERFLAREKIHVAFINDNGFYAGAGIATARQACSFALAGHDVSIIGLNPFPETALGCQRYKKWIYHSNTNKSRRIRYYTTSQLDLRLGRNNDKDHREMVEELLRLESWDLVILGNLHSDAISLRFLIPIFKRKLPLIWYAHDLDLLGGGCGYPQYYNCTQYKTKCTDFNCPRPSENYPCSANGRVERTYVLRSLLCEFSNISIACNSSWSQEQIAPRYPLKDISRIPYGIDTTVFLPTNDRVALRRKLGIDPGKFTIVVGADSVGRPGKGGEILNALIPAILAETDCQVIAFGDYPSKPQGVFTTGYLDDEESIANVFAAGDCFLNPVTIEALGQTVLEASACGCVPVVLAEGGGVRDIVEDGLTGLVAANADELLTAIKRLMSDKQLLRHLAKEGQERIAQEFSLERQYFRWMNTLTAEWGCDKKKRLVENRTHMDDSFHPLVSIVSVTLNCAEDLRTTASSLALQEFDSFEWIIQDGGSTDQTLDIVHESGLPYSIIQEEDSGIYDASNRAIGRCKGDWVLFLHAGDLLAGPNALKSVLNSIGTSHVDMIIASYIDVLIDGTLVERHPHNPVHKLQALRDGSFQRPGPHWLSGMPCHQGILIRREWLERFPFNLELPISADWYQMFSVIDAGAQTVMCDQILSWYPNGGYSFEHSDQWIADVVKIAKSFHPNQSAVDEYFSGAVNEQSQKCLERRYRRQALNRHRL